MSDDERRDTSPGHRAEDPVESPGADGRAAASTEQPAAWWERPTEPPPSGAALWGAAPAPPAPYGVPPAPYGAPASPYGAPPAPGASPYGAPPPSPGSTGPYDTLGRPESPAGRSLGSRTGLLATLAVLIALVAGAMGGALGLYVSHERDRGVLDGSTALPAPSVGSTARPSGSVAEIAGRTLPSVVAISVRTSSGGGTGSGFVIRADGYVVTNNHVVAEAVGGNATVEVQFSDQRTAKATIVGTDASYDLAVIKVAARDLPTVSLGNSDDVVVGDQVVAIGAPLGLAGTVTSGIISAKNRPVTAGQGGGDESFINALQTDAAINPGNSGGPLMDLSGRVIGVNSAIATLPGSPALGGSGQSGSIGLGFAIPINQARRTTEQLIRTGKSAHPVIGVALDTTYDGPGARIALAPVGGTLPVTPGGPAAKAGLRAGDVVTAVDGQKVNSNDELIVAIRARVPGASVSLTYERGGRTATARVTLGSSAG